MRPGLVLAALVGLATGVAACCGDGLLFALDPVYVVSEEVGFGDVARELEVHVEDSEVVLVHTDTDGSLRVRYAKVAAR